MADLTAGTVHVKARMALEDSGIAAGQIQSIATSAELGVRFG